MTKKTADRPADPETEEKQRIRAIALERKILRRSPSIPAAPLPPSKASVKLHGRDVARRGQRKSRYLFSFPGLIAPLAGGRIGDLADLATKNPTLYLEFPNGRMKLFGTHVYPKNKYLTLQLTKSTKGVMLEDIFESMIVFSDAWWIGKKEDNPQELQLKFPDLSEGQDVKEYDFKGGAGTIAEENRGGSKVGNDSREPLSPDINSDDNLSEDPDTKAGTKPTSVIELTPVRQSARNAGKKLRYAESSGDDSGSSDAEVPTLKIEKLEDVCTTASNVAAPECGLERKTSMTEKTEKSALPLKGSPKGQSVKKGSLVQSTLSSLFEKAADKKSKRKADESSGPKGPVSKRQKSGPKEQAQAKGSKKKGSVTGGKKNGSKAAPRKISKALIDDDIEDISSGSQDDSDGDWVE